MTKGDGKPTTFSGYNQNENISSALGSCATVRNVGWERNGDSHIATVVEI